MQIPFECEDSDNGITPHNCGNAWGNCLAAGTCLLSMAMGADDDFDYTFIDYPQADPDFDFFQREGRPRLPNEY